MTATGPVTVALVGYGNRTRIYSSLAESNPERMKVVAIAEPNPHRRQQAASRFSIPAKGQFASFEELANAGRIAEAVINGTHDALHHPSSMPLLKLGYHMLLEKPIARTEAEVRELIDTAAAGGCTVMICHVLRYSPFYATVRRLLDEGRVGRILSIRMLEAVSYHHMALAYVRGTWRKTETNPMLLSKSCHDLDLMAWFMSGVPPVRVSSAGGRTWFRPENAPPGSGSRCLTDCSIESTCPYSAKLLYIDKGLWGRHAWADIEHVGARTATREEKLRALVATSPYGRCVWRCDNDVVDHQSVLVEFADGATATLDMLGNSMRATRQVHIIGSHGEIEGDMETGIIRVRKPNFSSEQTAYEEEIVDTSDLSSTGGGHGGGDQRLVEDFIATIRGEPSSRGVTRIEDSLAGHQIGFAADLAMRKGCVIQLATRAPHPTVAGR